MDLSVPTTEQAERILGEVGSTQALVATIMSPSMGARAAHMRSVEMVEGFLEARTIDDFRAVGLRLDIHYVDFGALALWLDEVIGDAELATEIRSIHESGEAFGNLVPGVKALLGERLDQCRELVSDDERQVAAS